MSDSYITLSRLLKEDMPDMFLNSLTKQIKDAYSQAHGSAEKPVPEIYLETLAIEQGAWVQCKLHELASRYGKQGIEARLEPNSKQRAHLEIETERILASTHRVRSPNMLPPPANYRESNAATNQLWLTGLVEPQAPEDSKCNLYILHGPKEDAPKELGFVQVAVPDSRQKGYLATMTIYSTEEFVSGVVEEKIPETLIRLKATKKIDVS